MLRRSRLLLFALLALVAGACIWYALSSHPGVTKRNFQRIQAGMTLPEVEALMGGPPGSSGQFWGGGLFGDENDLVEWGSEQPPAKKVDWYLGHDNGFVVVSVGLDENGRVIQADYQLFRLYPEQSVLGRIRAWLGW